MTHLKTHFLFLRREVQFLELGYEMVVLTFLWLSAAPQQACQNNILTQEKAPFTSCLTFVTHKLTQINAKKKTLEIAAINNTKTYQSSVAAAIYECATLWPDCTRLSPTQCIVQQTGAR